MVKGGGMGECLEDPLAFQVTDKRSTWIHVFLLLLLLFWDPGRLLISIGGQGGGEGGGGGREWMR